jgi:hypothetical protein
MSSNPMKTFFFNLRLPLSRGESDVITFLDKHFSFFDSEIEKLLYSKDVDKIFPPRFYTELRDKKESIRQFSDAILESLRLYLDGRMVEAYSIFDGMMDKIQDNIVITDIKGVGVINQFFRIRPEKVSERRELFHIPFDKITRVKAYRYSVAGFPCLYLAGGPCDTPLSLCWTECGMPHSFTWVEYKLADSTLKIPLIDLTLSPFASAINSQHLVTSALNHKPINDFLIKMVTTYPLMAACSLVIEDKNQNFIPEYVIPQMLLGWVRKNDKIRGIAYFSCSSEPSAKLINAFNIALPPSKSTNVGYCKKLQKEFLLSKPELIDISDIFLTLRNNYLDVKSFRDWLKAIYSNYLAIDSIREMLSICDSFILLYETVINRKKLELSWAHQYIETLNLVSIRMADKKYFDLMVEQAELFLPNSVETFEKCSEIWDKFKVIKSEMSDFWDFDIKQFRANATDFQYVV